MAFYKLDDKGRTVLGFLLESVRIKGKAAKELLKISTILQQRENFPFIEIDREMAAFILGLIDEVEIIGKYALAVVQLQLIFSQPLDKLPKLSSKKTPKKTK